MDPDHSWQGKLNDLILGDPIAVAELAEIIRRAKGMAVRAKFKVTEITEHAYGAQLMKTIKLAPVFKTNDPNDENSRFWASSPNGEIRLGTINMDAAKQFEINAEFYVDFTKV